MARCLLHVSKSKIMTKCKKQRIFLWHKLCLRDKSGKTFYKCYATLHMDTHSWQQTRSCETHCMHIAKCACAVPAKAAFIHLPKKSVVSMDYLVVHDSVISVACFLAKYFLNKILHLFFQYLKTCFKHLISTNTGWFDLGEGGHFYGLDAVQPRVNKTRLVRSTKAVSSSVNNNIQHLSQCVLEIII